MEIGFFHPSRGYWQTIGQPSAEVAATYPAGTVQVPLKPGPAFMWNGTAWVAAADDTPPTTQITFAQLLIGLVAEGWISEAEGDAWLTGTPPAPVLALIAQLPEAQRFAAKARAVRPSVVLRNDPLVVALGAMQSKTPEQLDTFFNTYGAA